MSGKTFTHEQLRVVGEYVQMYGLQPEQISFDGNDTDPIFDYEAVCLLTLKLTDIHNIDSWVSSREPHSAPPQMIAGQLHEDSTRSTAKCTITLPDGRTRTAEDSAFTGELLGNGTVIEDVRGSDSMAMNRAVRRCIRSVGVNLHNAHRQFKTNGVVATGHTNHDPRLTHYNEIHVLATELDLIRDADKSVYRNYLAALFDGIESSKELNDLQLHQLLVNLRAMVALKRRDAQQAA